MEVRDAALDALNNAEKAASLANYEGRLNKLDRGDKEFVSAQRYLIRGNYEEARKRYQMALEYDNAT